MPNAAAAAKERMVNNILMGSGRFFLKTCFHFFNSCFTFFIGFFFACLRYGVFVGTRFCLRL